MASGNSFLIEGNLTADPEVRFTQGGEAVANFTIAHNERYFDRDTQEWKDGDSLFMRCNVWGKPAENVGESLKKGMSVMATGSLKQRSFETSEGEKRTVIELKVDHVGPTLAKAKAEVTKVKTRSDDSGDADQAEQPAASKPAKAAAAKAAPAKAAAAPAADGDLF